VQGIAARGVFGECDGVLSGYIGSAGIGATILEAVEMVKHANPSARYCCDPVIGDLDRGVYVDAGVAEFIRQRALPLADLITPNQFELDFLSGRRSATVAEICAAMRVLHERGPRVVLVTSVRTDDTPEHSLDLIAGDEEGAFRLRTPRLPVTIRGAGDAVAALFFMHHLRTGSLAEALSNAASSLFGILARTAEAGSQEMLLVEAQQELVAPSTVFPAERLPRD
jgi:pyridoxine kinase